MSFRYEPSPHNEAHSSTERSKPSGASGSVGTTEVWCAPRRCLGRCRRRRCWRPSCCSARLPLAARPSTLSCAASPPSLVMTGYIADGPQLSGYVRAAVEAARSKRKRWATHRPLFSVFLMTASELRSLGRGAAESRATCAYPVQGCRSAAITYITYMFRHLQRVPHASPSPRRSPVYPHL